MKKIVFKVIDTQVKDCLLYVYDDGLWIINPETKEWVIHVGASRLDYLWYNYEVFTPLFRYISLDSIEDKDYIQDWAEEKLKVKIGPNYHPDITPSEYDWSDEFKPEKVIESGKVIGDFCVPMYLS
jgi:hypothetical protein